MDEIYESIQDGHHIQLIEKKNIKKALAQHISQLYS